MKTCKITEEVELFPGWRGRFGSRRMDLQLFPSAVLGNANLGGSKGLDLVAANRGYEQGGTSKGLIKVGRRLSHL